MIRLIHLCNDEKFIDIAIDQFERLHNVKSVFVVCSQTSLKYVKSRNVVILDENEKILNFIERNPCDFVVLHSLYVALVDVSKICHPIIWNSWGMDVYSDKYAVRKRAIVLSLYKPLTRNFINENLTLGQKVKRLLSPLYKWRYVNNLRHIEYVSTVFPEEYNFIKKIKDDIKFFPFRYINICDEASVKSPSVEFKERFVLLGNSLDLTNNHLDVLSMLEMRKEKMTVVMPICYPQKNEKYKKRLLEFARSLHYVHVMPITEFMPIQDYVGLISQCSCAFFGHIRQQAVGNITEMLKNGSKVFLYRDSFAYKHYASMGCKVYCIEDCLAEKNLFDALDVSVQLDNNAIISKDVNPENYMNRLQLFFDELR